MVTGPSLAHAAYGRKRYLKLNSRPLYPAACAEGTFSEICMQNLAQVEFEMFLLILIPSATLTEADQKVL